MFLVDVEESLDNAGHYRSELMDEESQRSVCQPKGWGSEPLFAERSLLDLEKIYLSFKKELNEIKYITRVSLLP